MCVCARARARVCVCVHMCLYHACVCAYVYMYISPVYMQPQWMCVVQNFMLEHSTSEHTWPFRLGSWQGTQKFFLLLQPQMYNDFCLGRCLELL